MILRNAQPGRLYLVLLACAAIASPAVVPAGRILFMRRGSDEVEEYFTIKTDGTDEQPLFTREGCECVRWSGDRTRVLTLGETGHGTFSLLTMRPDGSDRVVTSPPIETLNLAPGASSPDGRRIAFAGWDETDPSRNGVYLGSPDLTDLRLVTPLPEGTTSVEPFGVTPDGSDVLFFADRGPEPHAGDLYVVEASGRGLRRMNPTGTTNFDYLAAGSLSPDGRRVAFGANNGGQSAVFVIDIDGGEARQITDWAGHVWSVSWSPTGDWITYTQQYRATSVIALVGPDGTGQRELSARNDADEVAGAAWSPAGDHLLVQRGMDERFDLWIMDLEGIFIAQVTHEPSEYGSYGWAPEPGS